MPHPADRPPPSNAPAARRLRAVDDVRSPPPPPRTGVTVVTREGEMDVASAPGLLRDARAALRTGAARLVLDLTGVAFADSTALAGLIQCRRVAYRAGVDMVVVCPPGPVLRLLQLTGLDAVMTLAPTLAEAVAAA